VNITAAIGRRSRAFISVFTVALLALAVFVRYLVPPRFSAGFIFLLPISFATWFLSWQVAAIIAVVAAGFLFRFDLRYTNAGAAVDYWKQFSDLVVATVFIYIFSELRDLYNRQIDLSRRDPLTGVLNRRGFQERLRIESQRINRHHRPMTIAYIDVDNFKSIDDRYGHAAGDEFLIGLGRHISTRLRATDHLARVGGDEFAIALPETDQVSARFVLGEIQSAMKRFSAGRISNATISMGAVTFSSDLDPEAMIAVADRAMYGIKQQGKNNIEYRMGS